MIEFAPCESTVEIYAVVLVYITQRHAVGLVLIVYGRQNAILRLIEDLLGFLRGYFSVTSSHAFHWPLIRYEHSTGCG